MTKYYQIIKRAYLDECGRESIGFFIARGQWADGHLAYSRLDQNGNVIEDEDCAYIQIRMNHGLLMIRI